MARRSRDYAAEYASRKEKATEEGWRSYGQKRKAKEVYRDDESVQQLWERQALEDDPDVFPREFAAFYRGLVDPKESKGRDRNSRRAKFFVEVTGTVASYDVWQERYA